MKKTVLKVVLCILVLLILANTAWYTWRTIKYGTYSADMDKSVFATWFVPSYVQTDADDYGYNVKYSDYLSLTGNLSVGCPATDDNIKKGCEV